MAQGFLVSCTSMKKRTKGEKIRFLKSKRAAGRFLKQYVDADATDPVVKIQVFNSNGYFEREVLNKEAIAEFVQD